MPKFKGYRETALKMKHMCAIIFLLSLFGVVLCTNDENCVWNYKCCVFKDFNGDVTCEKMCEPEIQCKPSETTTEEISSDAEEIDPYAPLEIKANACREGFQFRFGKCRKVLKQRIQD